MRDTGPGVQVQVLSGKVQVGRGKADKKPVVLDAGFQLFHPIGDPIGKPTKFRPPPRPFWK